MEYGNSDPFVHAIVITFLILLATLIGILIHSLCYEMRLIMPYFIRRCYGDRNQSTAYSDELPESYDTNNVLEMDMPPKYEDIELNGYAAQIRGYLTSNSIFADPLFKELAIHRSVSFESGQKIFTIFSS